MLDVGKALTSHNLRWGLQQHGLPLGRELVIRLSAVRQHSPDGLVALLALLDATKRRRRRLVCERPLHRDAATSLARAGLSVQLDELEVEHDLDLLGPQPSGSVFGVRRFDDLSQLNRLTGEAEEWVSAQSPNAGKLVYEALCEAGANVLDHSGQERGFVAVAVDDHDQVQFAVADSGIGFRESLIQRDPATDAAALRMALSGEVSSLPGLGRGRGLAWLAGRAAEDRGELAIVSGSASATVAEERGTSDEPSLRTVPPLLPGALVRGQAPLRKQTDRTFVSVA